MKKIFKIMTVAAFLFLSSCSIHDEGPPITTIEWVDVLKIQDNQYEYDYNSHKPLVEKGEKIGTVTYQMADHASINHKMVNGDAAYLSKGTPIYQLKGYPVNLAVLADDKVYVVAENEKAETKNELYPVGALVESIVLKVQKKANDYVRFRNLLRGFF